MVLTLDDIFNSHKGEFVVIYATLGEFPAWQKNRELYLYYDQPLDMMNLREIFSDEIIIEFDEVCNLGLNAIRNESIAWIRIIQNIFEQEQKHYWITDHKGKSPHFRFIVNGLKDVDAVLRSRYKKRIVTDILKRINFHSNNIKPDLSLCSKHKLIALEGSGHWKNKYGVVNVEHFSTHPIKELDKEVLTEIQKSHTFSATPHTQYREGSQHIDTQRFIEMMQKWYREGYRNNILMGLSAMMRKKGVSKEELMANLIKLSEYVEHENPDMLEYYVDRQYSQDITKIGSHTFFEAAGDSLEVHNDFLKVVVSEYDI